MLETRTELPDAGQLDGEATQEGDAPLVTTLLGAKGGDMVDLDEGDVPNSASRLQRKPFRQQTHQLLKLLPLKSATKPMKAFAPKAFQALKNLIKKPLALKPSRFDFVPTSHSLLVRANDGLRNWSKLVLVQSRK